VSLIIPQFSILTDVCAVRVPFHFTRSVDHEIEQKSANHTHTARPGEASSPLVVYYEAQREHSLECLSRVEAS
jgi:hypothetical protein